MLALALAASAGARSTFRPRIGHAMGIVPPLGHQAEAAASNFLVAYHGGQVMRNVTIHTVFWAPPGYHFDGSPGDGVATYEALIKQFLTDVGRDSGSSQNVFSILDQYGDGAGPGGYRIQYDPAVDSVDDTHPYPSQLTQCPSPAATATCVTDLELQQELDRLIGASGARGLSNLWFIFLPPNVDTCITLGSCATNAYAGYHSLFDLGHGATVYSPIPDPLLELTPSAGQDPEGNPEAESTVDTVAHELVEAITDPEGTGWMDPNGFEVADKCETGPQLGTPLGYAADGSPYNELINGHEYLIQGMWSNPRNGCVQSSPVVSAVPALHTLNLRQFSPQVSGSIGVARRVPVTVGLVRHDLPVAEAHAETRADGSWGPVTLRGPGGRPHAVGDDRDVIEVVYGLGPRSPTPDFVATGDGGNPFTEAGYTGWFDLDNGYALVSGRPGRSQIAVGPCSQTGVLTLRVGATLAPSPTEQCQNAPDAALVTVPRVRPGETATFTSEDNRGEYLLQPVGTLVSMTVTLGEQDSVSALGNAQLEFPPSGFPACTALLRIRTVRCSGLVPGERYRLTRQGRALGRARAGAGGVAAFGAVPVRGGDVVALVNPAGRLLTSLHVAHLRVAITGNQTVAAAGTCEPGDYWAGPLTKPPVTSQVGAPLSNSTPLCPTDGHARGLPATGNIVQSDDFSAGATETQVPLIESTAPIQDETLYGGFIASAQSGLPGPHGTVLARGVPISLSLSPSGSRRVVFRAANVDSVRGVAVPALTPGPYQAKWTLRDAAGDTRTVVTRFVDEG